MITPPTSLLCTTSGETILATSGYPIRSAAAIASSTVVSSPLTNDASACVAGALTPALSQSCANSPTVVSPSAVCPMTASKEIVTG